MINLWRLNTRKVGIYGIHIVSQFIGMNDNFFFSSFILHFSFLSKRSTLENAEEISSGSKGRTSEKNIRLGLTESVHVDFCNLVTLTFTSIRISGTLASN